VFNVDIEIARTGRHTDKHGRPVHLSLKRLQEIAQGYNPEIYQAPLIIAHKTGNVPDSELVTSSLSFGTPTTLKVVGDRLKASFDKFSPAFTEWVRNKNLLAISPGFYTPNHPSNPTPGKWALREISALGSEPPAIKGLQPLSEAFDFSEAEDGIVCLEFAEPDVDAGVVEFAWGDRYVVQILRRLRDYMVVEKGAEEAEKVIPIETLTWAMEGAASPDAEDRLWPKIDAFKERLESLEERLNASTRSFSEGGAMPLKPYLQQLLRSQVQASGKDAAAIAQESGVANFSELLDSNGEASDEQLQRIVDSVTQPVQLSEPSDRELELERKLAEIERQGVVSFVEAQVNRGAVLPGEKTAIVELLVSADHSSPVEFSEGSETKTLKLGDSFRSFLQRLTPAIEFAEIATADVDEEPIEFSEPAGYEVNAEKKALMQKAKAYQRKHPNVDFIAAYKAVGGK
jgi:hypothetical protein